MKRAIFIILFFALLVWLFAQNSKHDYVVTITVENVSVEKGEKILDEIYKLQNKYEFKMDLYRKNEFNKRMNLKIK